MTPSLPAPFADLQGFVADWSATTIEARATGRDLHSTDECAAFHAVLAPRIESMLNYLDAKPLNQLDAEERTLLYLALSWVHAALAIEIQGESEDAHRLERIKMRITPD
jgi:hypothetical protein